MTGFERFEACFFWGAQVSPQRLATDPKLPDIPVNRRVLVPFCCNDSSPKPIEHEKSGFSHFSVVKRELLC